MMDQMEFRRIIFGNNAQQVNNKIRKRQHRKWTNEMAGFSSLCNLTLTVAGLSFVDLRLGES